MSVVLSWNGLCFNEDKRRLNILDRLSLTNAGDLFC